MKQEEAMEKIAHAIGDIDEKFLTKDYFSTSKKRGKKMSVKVLLLAAALPMLGAAGYGTGFFSDVVSIFSPSLGDSQVQTEIIEEIAKPVKASATNNGLTITLEAMIGDDSTATLVFYFQNEDGTPYILPEIPENKVEDGKEYYYRLGFSSSAEGFRQFAGSTDIGFLESSAHGSMQSRFENQEATDGSFYYEETYNFDNLPLGEPVTAVFGALGYEVNVIDLETYTDVPEERVFVPFTEGLWEIDYIFEYTDTTLTLVEQTTLTHDGREIQLEKMSVSPLSVKILLSFPKLADTSALSEVNWQDLSEEELDKHFEDILEANKVDSEYLDNIPFYLTKKDGTNVTLESNNFGVGSNDGDENVNADIQVRFDEIIPLEDIATLTFGEVTAEVTP